MDDAVLYSVDSHVATLTLNRPDTRNALRADVMDGLFANMKRAAEDTDVRCVVLTGTGKAFCAGGDLGGMQGADNRDLTGYYERSRYFDLFAAVWHFDKPIIAAVNGYAYGAGLGIVSLADLAIAVDTAKFGTPERRVGLFPMMISSMLLRNVPRKIALEMMYLGHRIDAQRAYDVGLINASCTPDTFAATVQSWAVELTQASLTAMQLGRAAIQGQDTMTLDQALPYLNSMFALNVGTAETQEGIDAFFEKRDPDWLA